MSIAFDATSQGNSNGSSDYTYDHVCTGSNGYLLVATTVNATAVTYNSVSLSLLISYTPTSPPGTNCPGIKVWGLSAPATGTNAILVTAGADLSVAVSYTGVLATPVEASSNEDSANNQVSTFSNTVTTISPNAWRVGFFMGNNNYAQTLTAGSGTTLRGSRTSFTTGYAIGVMDSNSAIVTPASYTLNNGWTSGSGFMTSTGISMAPVFPQSSGGFLINFY